MKPPNYGPITEGFNAAIFDMGWKLRTQRPEGIPETLIELQMKDLKKCRDGISKAVRSKSKNDLLDSFRFTSEVLGNCECLWAK